MTSAEYHSKLKKDRANKIKSIIDKIEVKETVTKKLLDQRHELNRQASLLHVNGPRLLKPQKILKEAIELLDESYQTICMMRGVQTEAKNRLLSLV